MGKQTEKLLSGQREYEKAPLFNKTLGFLFLFLLGFGHILIFTTTGCRRTITRNGNKGETAGAFTAGGGGATHFKQACAACHRIGGGQLVGPDLKGVTERRSHEWLSKFIKSSQSMVKSGDPDAVALFNKFNKIVMPDPALDSRQIGEVIAYLKTSASGSTVAVENTAKTVFTKEDVVLGQDLFQGKVRLRNGGPSCNSCHDVQNDAVIGGGILARELTTVFSRLGAPGVRAILGNSPFPVMERAYRENPLEEEEVASLMAFLQQADREHKFQKPKDYGWRLVLSGALGVVILLTLYTLFWSGRKKQSVYQEIYDRQIKSV